jgi:hypothetical protein
LPWLGGGPHFLLMALDYTVTRRLNFRAER